MKYTVLVIEKSIYRWTIEAGSAEEATYLAKQFFRVSEERSEHFLYSEQAAVVCDP